MKSRTSVKGVSGLSAGFASGVASALSLLRIEFRRSAGLLLIPVLLAGAGLLGWGYFSSPVTLWSDMSVLLHDVAIFTAPFLGGIAAWMAGRERRRGARELLGTTPRPEFSRWLATWSATALWGVLAYTMIGASLFLVTHLRATWGAPILWPIAVGALTLPAYAALGYALGHYVPSRLTAPLAAIGLAAGPLLLVNPGSVTEDSIAWMSPSIELNAEVWFGVEPEGVGLTQTLLMTGLLGIGLGSLAIKGRRGIPRWGGLIAGGVLLGLSAITTSPSFLAAPDTKLQQYEMIAYEPVCQDGVVPVCVHPAYEPVLGEISASVDQLAEPLAGLPGLPEKVEQVPGQPKQVWGRLATPPMEEDALGLDLPSYSGDAYEGTDYAIAAGLVSEQQRTVWVGEFQYPLDERGSAAQNAIQVWMLRGAGREPRCGNSKSAGIESIEKYGTASCEAAERFAALSSTEQRTWLEENYADLRTGKLTLKDLP